MTADAPDAVLVQFVVARDEKAFEILFYRYSRQVFSLVLRILKSRTEADEVVQDVFWSLWKNASRFDGSRAPLLAWLLIIARSRALDRLRSVHAKVSERGELSATVLARSPALVASSTKEREFLVEELLHSLPTEQKRVVRMIYFEGYGPSEIALRVGAPLETVKGRKKLALKKLRIALEPATL
ncbi:MAG: RNA polymerase sigma factor [Bryobacteraceae bacterium]